MKIGVDIACISRFKKVDEHFINRVLTAEESKVYDDLPTEKKILFLAGRWASKEAIFKALNNPNYLNYSILNDNNGRPYVLNHPEINISLSHDGDYVVSFVIIE